MLIDTDKQNCATCANWSEVREVAIDDGSTGPGPVSRRLCVIAEHVMRWEEDPGEDREAPWLEDGSDYQARMYTPATFSCAKWAPK